VADRLLLVGMMGSGKSTVARLAAQRLGWAWTDVDDEVERARGATVAELFARGGEEDFRRQEADTLRAVLGRPGPMVVSVGGGAVLEAANRRALRESGTVVWLRATPETLVARVGDGAGRPLLAGGPAAALRRIDEVRRPLYEEVAHHVVDVDGLEAAEVAGRVLQVVGADADGRACP